MTKFDDPITTEPSQIATALLAQGLPAAIASQILDTGVKVIDVPVTLLPLTPLNSGANIPNGGTIQLAPIATSGQQSLEILVQFPSQPGVGNAPPACWAFLVEWDMGGGVYGLRQSVALYSDSDDHNATIIVPCRGQSARITVLNSTGFAAKLSVQVVGSQRPVDRVLVRQLITTSWGWSLLGDESALVATNFTGNAGTNLPLPIHSGAARIVIAPDAAVTALGRFILLSHNNIWSSVPVTMPVNANRVLSIIELDAYMPLAPMYLQWLNTPVGPANVSVSVTWES